MDLLSNVGMSFVSAFIVFMFMWMAKLLVDRRVKGFYNADYEIEEGNNVGVALRRAGLYLGIAVAMFGAMKGSFLIQILDGFIILGFMMIAMCISDRLIFPNIKNSEVLKNGNVSVGFVEGGLYLGTGIIAFASFEGLGPWYASAVFFVLGQALLLAMTRIFELVYPNILKEIEEGHLASGILLAGIIIAYSLILKAAVEGPFVSWEEDFISFGTSAVMGIIMLLIFANQAVDKIFLPGTNIKQEIEDNNPAAMIVVVTVKIAVAYIISAVVL